MNATVDRQACVRCGLCPAICPAVFTIAERESARAVTPQVPEEAKAAAQKAADSCPTGAITLLG